MNTTKVLVVAGTRPEVIKIAPVMWALHDDPFFSAGLLVTAQHRQLLDQALSIFGLLPDCDLDIMSDGQDFTDVTMRVLDGMREALATDRPDIVLVQGDTTTTFATALAAFYAGIPVGHIEAGLRSGDLRAPYPEEANRSMLSRIARLHFAPTERCRRNLLAEGLDASTIFVTGNTVVDALGWIRARLATLPAETISYLDGCRFDLDRGLSTILVTAHRRENFGPGLERICTALAGLAAEFAEWQIVFPVHPNPNVRRIVTSRLAVLPNVHLIEPVTYAGLVGLMEQCRFVITDSGGLQEEAPSFGKPVLVIRDITERIEAIEAGTALLVGTDSALIIDASRRLITDQAFHQSMVKAQNPFGDGTAALQIAALLKQHFRHPSA